MNIIFLLSVIEKKSVEIQIIRYLDTVNWLLVVILCRYFENDHLVRSNNLSIETISEIFSVPIEFARQSLCLAFFCISINEFLSKWTGRKDNYLSKDIDSFKLQRNGLNQLLRRTIVCISKDSFSDEHAFEGTKIALPPKLEGGIDIIWFRYAFSLHMLSLNFTSVRNQSFKQLNDLLFEKTGIDNINLLFNYLKNGRIQSPTQAHKWNKYLADFVHYTIDIYQHIFRWLNATVRQEFIEKTLQLLAPNDRTHFVHDITVNLHGISHEASRISLESPAIKAPQLTKLHELRDHFHREAAFNYVTDPLERDYARALAGNHSPYTGTASELKLLKISGGSTPPSPMSSPVPRRRVQRARPAQPTQRAPGKSLFDGESDEE